MKNLYILLLLTFGLGQDYSLSFDGVDDYVQIEQSEQFAIGNSSHTLMTWAYFYELSDMEYNYLIALGNNATGEQSSLGVTKDGKLFYFISREIDNFCYLDFDLPEVLCCASYFQIKSLYYTERKT